MNMGDSVFVTGEPSVLYPAEASRILLWGGETLPADSLFGRDVSRESASVLGRMGCPGESLPYRLCTDTGVELFLLAAFLGMCLIYAGGRRFLFQLIKDFFFFRSRRNSAVRTGEEIRYLSFLFVQCAFLLALLYGYCSGSLLRADAPLLLLSVNVLAVSGFLLTKLLLCEFVNKTFYDKISCHEWKVSYLLLVALEGVLLYPLAFMGVFYEVSVSIVIICLIIVQALSEILLFYKSFAIFFGEIHGLLHLIVYFCALEIVPILAFRRILAYLNEVILTNI
ncbi:MAG: DUF4271 domain-containing protein [Clostridium sp.]|nr:DUF4271 domain-containing protein [Clostridium sp.]